MIVISYFWGQKFYKIKYDLVSISIYIGLALLLYLVSVIINVDSTIGKLWINTILFLIFIVFILWKEDLKGLLTGKMIYKKKR